MEKQSLLLPTLVMISLITLVAILSFSEALFPKNGTLVGVKPLLTMTTVFLSAFMSLYIFERSSANSQIEAQNAEIRKIKAARPYLKVTYGTEKNVLINISYPDDHKWLVYPDIFFNSKFYKGDRLSENNCHQQMGSVFPERIMQIAAIDNDQGRGTFSFLLEASTVFNEKIYIYSYSGKPLKYFFDPINGLTDSSLAEDQNYQESSKMNKNIKELKQDIFELDPEGKPLQENKLN
ncbi:hypothetical protein [Oenococcus oeni]|uniref:hypothetical protein n=1 Tax=Oenococcus oeni TaxID=1247 RepID=UPI0010B26537|nr:hypothetical protein [Oenococcus oeni]SYW16182.1 hypothetical protein OENI_30014 [Oenococcus oeni]